MDARSGAVVFDGDMQSVYDGGFLRWLYSRNASVKYIAVIDRYTGDDSISKEDLMNLMGNMSHVEGISIENCTNVDDDVARMVIENCSPSLDTLKVSYGRDISEATWLMLANRCHGLKSLGVPRCDQFVDTALAVLLDNCPRIESLDLTSCEGITAPLLLRIPQAFSALRELTLDNIAVSDGLLTMIAQHSPRLEVLNINDCFDMTEDGLMEIATRLRNIRKIGLADLGPVVTDAVLTRMAENWPHLMDIDLRDCRSITDAGLIELANCHRLRNVNVVGCVNISDVSIQHLVAGCPDLLLTLMD